MRSKLGFGIAGGSMLVASVALATACGGGSGARAPIGPASSATATAYTPPSATDESKRVLAEALETDEPKERCAKLQEAVALDGASYEAQITRAESRCASAKDLLENARESVKLKLEPRSANALIAVALRAESANDAIHGAEVLLESTSEDDLDSLRMAARTLARFGKQARAAKVFESIAKARAAKAAPLDALDAQLDAVLAHARSKATPTPTSANASAMLMETLAGAAAQTAGYGAGWLGPKIVEAIAALRIAGDAAGADAAAKKVRETKGLATSDTLWALDLEQAIGDARAEGMAPVDPKKAKGVKATPGKHASYISAAKTAGRVTGTISRAYLAVEAKLAGNCAAARSYGHAYAALPRETIPRVDEDVAWAIDCAGGDETPSLLPSIEGPAVEDARGVAAVDRTRGRSMLAKWLSQHPDDVAAQLALSAFVAPDEVVATIERALEKSPNSLALHVRRFEALEGGVSRDLEGQQIVTVLLPSMLEVKDDPRAAAPVLARLLLAWGSAAPTAFGESLSTALLTTCAAPPSSASCVDRPQAEAFSIASGMLREKNPEALSKLAPALANVDLQPRIRLDSVLALVATKRVSAAATLAGATRGAWEGAEASLARAVVAASSKDCAAAKRQLGGVIGLPIVYDPTIASVADRCSK